MPLDHYVTLGRSGLRVSPFCLGAMTFGEQWGWGSDKATTSRIIDAFMERGGNFIDTANIYTKGHSEKLIGEHFRAKKGAASNRPRDRAVIATKFMGNLYTGDPNGGGAGRKAVMQACEESLRRLQTDYIDLYWAHFHDPHTPLEEMVRAMDDLVTQGKVRYIGLSDHPAWVCADAQHLLRQMHGRPLIALQIEYSLVQRTVEAELMPMAQHFGMGVTPWSPLAGGVLTGKYTRENKDSVEPGRGDWVKNQLTDRNLDIVEVLVKVADEAGASAAQVALAWVQRQPGVSSTIIGARTMEQLEDNLGALDVTLTDEQMGRLDEVSAVKHPFPHDFLKGVLTGIQGGTTVNGETRDAWPMAPEDDSERA